MLPLGAHGMVLETAKSSGAWQYVCIGNVHASFGFGQQGFIDAARLERLAACDPARAFSGVFTAGRVASRLDVSPARQLAGLAAGEPAGSSQRAKKKNLSCWAEINDFM